MKAHEEAALLDTGSWEATHDRRGGMRMRGRGLGLRIVREQWTEEEKRDHLRVCRSACVGRTQVSVREGTRCGREASPPFLC